MMSAGARWLRASLACLAAACVAGMACMAWLPSSQQSREVALWQALPDMRGAAQAPAYGAAQLCADWAGEGRDKVDCRNGYRVDTLTPTGSGAQDAWRKAQMSLDERLAAYEDLNQSLQKAIAAQPNPALAQVVFHLKARSDRWQDRWSQLKLRGERDLVGSYPDLFSLMLDLQGQTYDPVGNRFRPINWHIARALDSASVIYPRGRALKQYLEWAPWANAAMVAALLMLGWWCWGWTGWCLMGGLSLAVSMGYWVVSDASIRFGEGSAVFTFNPLGNQLLRQSHILLGLAALPFLLVLTAPWLSSMIKKCSQWPGMLLAGLLAGVMAGYGLMGPATGSELLKVGMAVAAGTLTAMQGRSVYLAAHLAPQALRPWFLIQQALRRPPSEIWTDSVATIGHKLGRSILQMTGYAMAGLAAAALLFHDLGATLVTACIAVGALYFVFGTRIAVFVFGLMAVAALLAGQTAKVQSRLALMTDPLNAAISDFARLVAFVKSTPDYTLGFGKIPWCNGVGSCIPLQSLSDYMPVVLAGAIGRQATVAYFLLFVLALMVGMAWLIRRSLTQTDLAARALTLTAFYLLLGTLVQTVVTFLGNWRVIPLTGLGTPLVSIGLSSFLAPVLAVGLILALPRIEQQRAGL